MTPEQLPGQPFGPVPLDGATHFPGRGDAEPCDGPAVAGDEDRHETAVDSRAGVVGALKIRPAEDALRAWQRFLSLRRQP